MSPRTIAVIGGGISGISAAVALARSGHCAILFEAGDRLGGRIGVDDLADRPIMMGGKNIGHRYTRLRALLADLDAGRFQPFGINTSTVRAGRLLPLDSSRPVTSLRSLRAMGAPRDLLRLALLARAVRRDDHTRFLGSPRFRQLANRHDDPALTDYFGPLLSQSLLRLATIRMNGAEPDEAYLGNLGTNLGLLTDTFDQLDDGLGPALARVSNWVDARLSSRVTALRPHPSGVVVQWEASSASPSAAATGTQHVDGLVLALPAHAAAPLLEPLAPDAAQLLHRVHYFPATVAVARYADDVFGPHLRAIALPNGPCSNAGAYGSSDRDLVRYTFSGRRGRLGSPTRSDIDTLLADAETSVSHAIGRTLPARLDWTWRHWPAAYCAYSRHHGRLLDELTTQMQPLANRITLAGDYLLGASLEACCRSGETAASALTLDT